MKPARRRCLPALALAVGSPASRGRGRVQRGAESGERGPGPARRLRAPARPAPRRRESPSGSSARPASTRSGGPSRSTTCGSGCGRTASTAPGASDRPAPAGGPQRAAPTSCCARATAWTTSCSSGPSPRVYEVRSCGDPPLRREVRQHRGLPAPVPAGRPSSVGEASACGTRSTRSSTSGCARRASLAGAHRPDSRGRQRRHRSRRSASEMQQQAAQERRHDLHGALLRPGHARDMVDRGDTPGLDHHHDVEGMYVRKAGVHRLGAVVFWRSRVEGDRDPARPRVGGCAYFPRIQIRLSLLPDLGLDDLREFDLPQPVVASGVDRAGAASGLDPGASRCGSSQPVGGDRSAPRGAGAQVSGSCSPLPVPAVRVPAASAVASDLRGGGSDRDLPRHLRLQLRRLGRPVLPAGAGLARDAEHYASTSPRSRSTPPTIASRRPLVLAHMAERTPPGFRFTVKLHGDHTTGACASRRSLVAFLAALEPLERAGKFAGALAQFPYSFRAERGEPRLPALPAGRLRDARRSSWSSATSRGPGARRSLYSTNSASASAPSTSRGCPGSSRRSCGRRGRSDTSASTGATGRTGGAGTVRSATTTSTPTTSLQEWVDAIRVARRAQPRHLRLLQQLPCRARGAEREADGGAAGAAAGACRVDGPRGLSASRLPPPSPGLPPAFRTSSPCPIAASSTGTTRRGRRSAASRSRSPRAPSRRRDA